MVFDSKLSLDSYMVAEVSNTSEELYLIYQLGFVLSQSDFMMAIHALIISYRDYPHMLNVGLPLKNIQKLHLE